ncbi:MAG: amino acid adenylation domain-containing protein, partial [bacterium]|nr:amino acid adenylation domain-containing protein [bacterium]
IKKFISYFKRLTAALTETNNREQPLAVIDILSQEEKEEILKLSTGEYETPLPDMTIHRFFEEQTERTPDHVAVVGVEPGTKVTYRQLNRKSNRLANELRSKGIGCDSVVALMVERSIEMIVALLGIMKAGGAYLPIDTGYPEERIDFMLRDSGAKVLVTGGKEIKDGGTKYQLSMKENSASSASSTVQAVKPGPANSLAYVIYTSGTTGKPKGVMIEHRNVVNLFVYDYRYTNIDFNRILQFHTIGFDASFHEIFGVLLNGGTSVLILEETRTDIPALLELVARERIGTLFLPMSFLKIIFSDEEYVNCLPRCIRHIQTAGEQVVVNERFKTYLREHNIWLHNHYGPSETHVVTALTVDPNEEIPDLPSIGRPILNTTIYILDKSNRLLPIGAVGELCIGGIQVGRGYLNQPEMTKEKFELSSPLYHTGDLAQWQADGNIRFLGRMDHQVKIRGFRVEPGEIENRLLNYSPVKEAVVIARKGRSGDNYLCAYFTSGDELAVSQLRDYLAKDLPDYMVPSYFERIDEVPLTPNGKVDRKALPEPELQVGGLFIAASCPVELKLTELWAGVLGIKGDQISTDTNFFHLGGHSLNATVLAARMHKEFRIKAPLAVIFKFPTISGLAKYIATNAGATTLMLESKGINSDHYASIEPVEKMDYYSLSSAQKRLYILHQMDLSGTGYNLTLVLPFGKTIETNRLESTLRELI